MISKFSVKKPYTVAVGVIMVLILGFVSFMNMTTDLLPSIDLPIVIVSTTYPGASPEKVESSVTKPLEQALSTTSGLENINSVSSENASMVMLEFNQEVNMDSAIIDVNGKIDMVKGYFDDSVSSPVIIKMNPDMMPIMMLSVDIEGMDIKEVTKYVNDNVIPQFERIEGVASVDATGLVEDKLKISLDEAKINEINNKILANIDSEIGKQQKELTDAKNELSNSKSELAKQKKTQTEQLESALKEIQSAKAKLQGAVSAIGMSKEQLEENIDLANAAYAQNQLQVTVLKEALSKLPEEAQECELIKSQIATLEDAGNQMKAGITAAKQGIQAIDSLADLEVKEKELASGKLTLEKEFANAETQISQGESQLDSAQEQLESAKESAYKSADIKDKITPDMIGNILMAENFSMPAGYIKEGETQYSVKVGDKFETVEELENLLLFNIDVDGVGDVKLRDVATVEFTDNSSDMYTNVNGNPGIMLNFQKSSAYSTANVTKAVREKIEDLSASNTDMKITTLSDQGVYIDMIIDSVLSNLIYGGVLAVIVLLLFLRSFKTTMVVAFSIPISVLFAIVLMYFSGVTLNIISLSGLALGVGMLVDNSIVVIENIYRLRSEGMSKVQAAVYGAKQVSGAIFASTLTTIGVFLPIVFTSGITKELFVDMGLTIGYSLVASLIVALTVVPAMSSTMLTNVGEKEHKIFNKFVNMYEFILRKSLKYKVVVLLIAVGLLGFCGYKITTMGTSFMPAMDSTQMTVTISVDDESSKSDLYAMSDDFIDRLLSIEDIDTIGALESSSMSLMGSSSGNEMMTP